MEEQTELLLSTIWKYQDAGVQRVLAALRAQHPRGHYTFDQETGWFRVLCDKRSARAVQESFRKVQYEIEGDVRGGPSSSSDGIPENEWLAAPTPGELPPSPDHLDQKDVDLQSPAVFDKYKFSKVWTRLKEEVIATTTVASFVSPEAMKAICAASGAFAAPDQTGRLVYLGADSADSISQASTMLDNMLKRHMFVMPPPKHILQSEVADGIAYHVDTRYMAHVNMGLLTSTIFDPAQYPGNQMTQVFKAAFSRAVCLRICLPDRTKRFEVSFFGPKAKPAFEDDARLEPVWFTDAQYVSKITGMPPPKVVASAAASEKQPSPTHSSAQSPTLKPTSIDKPNMTDNATNTYVGGSAQNPHPVPAAPQATEIDVESFDLLGLGSADGEGTSTESATSKANAPAAATLPPPLPENSKHGYQMRMLWQFMNNPSPASSKPASRTNSLSGTAGYGHKGTKDEQQANGKPAVPTEEKLITFEGDTPSTPPLADVSSESEADFGPLIPVPCQTMVLAKTPSTTKSLSRRTALTESVRRGISKLVADLPYSRGRVRLQAELGRIFIMDANPTGLAFNAPGERAIGWTAKSLLARLSTTCVSPESVVFSKCLSIFASDIENLLAPIGLGDDDAGSAPAGPSPTAAWSIHEKRVVYEFRCQRFYKGRDGNPVAQSPFLVEIDGTRPEEFSYSIRRIEDTRPPIWIHCIKRHWDARVVASYSQTETLEEMYGEFARDLLRTLVVPGGPMSTPKFQVGYDRREKSKDGRSFCTIIKSARVRNVARFIGNGDQSFLDVSWNRHMTLEKRAGKGDPLCGTFRGTPAIDDPARGMFASWYEVSIASAQAEEAFRENETLPIGGGAAWGSNRAKQDAMFAAIVDPALDLVKKMDGVGVLMDNGQSKMWTPPMRAPDTAPAINAFW